MPLRLIEIYHQKGKADVIEAILKDVAILDTWHMHLPDGETFTKILLRTENTQSVFDTLQNYFGGDETLRITVLPVEATVPRPEEEEEDKEEKSSENNKTSRGVSIEELYQKMSSVSGVTRKYIVMASLASFVAALGLLKNDVAVIIGSMVIAPLLSPNMSLALSTTLADGKLAKKSIITNIAGFMLVLFIGIAMGFLMQVDPDIPQIAARSDVSHFYIFLALATGIAGAYSVTTGVAEALVGVMVAVALLPPLVATGLLTGSGYPREALGALLLTLINVVSVNLAGVVTFLFQGIRPRQWWEAEKAKRAVRMAIFVWSTLLLLLAILIFFNESVRTG